MLLVTVEGIHYGAAGFCWLVVVGGLLLAGVGWCWPLWTSGASASRVNCAVRCKRQGNRQRPAPPANLHQLSHEGHEDAAFSVEVVAEVGLHKGLSGRGRRSQTDRFELRAARCALSEKLQSDTLNRLKPS